MNPTPNQITECDDERQLRELAAVYCMGWTEIPENHDGFKVFECNQKGYIRDWQPTSPTEEGKAQCWDLMERFRITVYGKLNMVAGDSTTWHYGEFTSTKTRQIAVVKAAILAALNGEE